jgi:DUF2934 family protein
MINNTTRPAFIVLSVEDIARRAYELYLERGRADGFDRDDWRRAERELALRGRDRQTDGPIVRTYSAITVNR